MLDTVFARYEVLCFMMWVKKRRYLICITIARNWRLHMDLSTHLLAVHSACSRRWRFLGIAKLPQTLNPFFLLWDYNYIVLSLVLGLNILRLECLSCIGFKSAQILDILPIWEIGKFSTDIPSVNQALSIQNLESSPSFKIQASANKSSP